MYTWQVALLKNRPKFILLGFKDSDISFTKNNSKFIQDNGANNKFKSLRVKLNNSNYPMNKMQFDIATNNQIEPYLAYVNLCKEFKNKPQLNMLDFQNLYSVFCFDVSAQDEKLIINGCNLIIEIVIRHLFRM